MPSSSSHPRVCRAVPRLGTLLVMLSLGSCGRVGYDSLSSHPFAPGGDQSREAGPSDPMAEADGGDDARADGGDDSDASAGQPGGDSGLMDAGPLPPDADAQIPVCAPCGLGDSCIAGSCVAECAGTYAGAVSCEGFENGLTDLTYSSGVTAETSLVHTGSGALRTESSGASVISRVTFALSPALTSGTLYFRGYYYIETPPADGLIKLVGLRTSAEDNLDLNVYPDRSLDLYFHEMGGARVASAAGQAVFNAWMCLQVELEISDTNGKVTVSVDSLESLASPSDRDTLTATGINRVEAGIAWSETSGETVVYVDDVVVDTAPVPCQ